MGFIAKFLDWFSNISKFSVYLSSIVFAVSGITLMATSLIMFFNDRYILVFDLLNFIPLSVFIYIFFPLGLILFIFGVWGCSALIRSNKFSLNVFFILNFGVFGTVLAGVVMTQIEFIPELKDVTTDYLNNVTLNYNERYNIKMDDYQIQEECCGLANKETCFNWENGVPTSCLCQSEDCVLLDDSCFNQTDPFQVYKDSCTRGFDDTLNQFVTAFETISKLIAIVCFVTVVFLSFVICCGNCNKK